MWGSWYLPIFLLRDGSLTITYIASLMVLTRVCHSLPAMEKLSMMIWDVGMVVDGGRRLEVFL